MANKQVKVTSFKNTGGLKAAIITADKPEKIKQKEKEEELKKQKQIREEGGTKPFVSGYNGRKPRRINDGGLIRLKRR